MTNTLKGQKVKTEKVKKVGKKRIAEAVEHDKVRKTFKKTAAIFDIDGTIFRDSLLLKHLEKGVQYDLFPVALEEEIKPYKRAWENRELDYDDYLNHAAVFYTKYLKGKNVDDVEFVARKVLEKEGKKLYTYTKDRIEWHKEQGHEIIFISGSPNFLVDKLAEQLGAKVVYSSVYVTKDSVFTGDVIPMWDSKSKETVMNGLAKFFDFATSYAYGDTSGDYEMLMSVAYPTAINPNQKLLNQLQKVETNCKIVVERKDVIYHIK